MDALEVFSPVIEDAGIEEAFQRDTADWVLIRRSLTKLICELL